MQITPSTKPLSVDRLQPLTQECTLVRAYAIHEKREGSSRTITWMNLFSIPGPP